MHSEPNSSPNFGLTQPNFALTQPYFYLTGPNFPLTQNVGTKIVKINALSQPNFGLTQPNFSSNSKFWRKMVKLVALTQKICQKQSNFCPNSAQKRVQLSSENGLTQTSGEWSIALAGKVHKKKTLA